MRFTADMQQGVRVLAIQGHFTGGPDTEAIRSALGGWIEAGERSFLLDLAGIELLNSIGLGGLVASYTTCAREGATLKLCGLSERNRRAAYISRILDLFEDYPDREQALASFQDQANA